MNKIFTSSITRVVVVLLFSLTTSIASAQSNNGNQKTVMFTVSMHCSVCKEKVDKHVKKFKGVKSFISDLSERTVIIVYDPHETDEQTLKKSIEKLGFKVYKKN